MRQASQPASRSSPWRDRPPSLSGRMLVLSASSHNSLPRCNHSSIHPYTAVQTSWFPAFYTENCHLGRPRHRQVKPATLASHVCLCSLYVRVGCVWMMWCGGGCAASCVWLERKGNECISGPRGLLRTELPDCCRPHRLLTCSQAGRLHVRPGPPTLSICIMSVSTVFSAPEHF